MDRGYCCNNNIKTSSPSNRLLLYSRKEGVSNRVELERPLAPSYLAYPNIQKERRRADARIRTHAVKSTKKVGRLSVIWLQPQPRPTTIMRPPAMWPSFTLHARPFKDNPAPAREGRPLPTELRGTGNLQQTSPESII